LASTERVRLCNLPRDSITSPLRRHEYYLSAE
jgi:hypothetical protein